MKEEPLKIRVPAAPVGSSRNHPISGEAAVFLLIVAQLAALLFVIRLFKLEEGHGLIVILIPLFVGFIIHGLLPAHFRIPFFLLLSLAVYGLVIGPVNTLIVLGIGAGLILLAHLPIHFWHRVLLLSIVAVVLALFRSEILPSGWGASLLPIVGSIFMFRLILYLYESRQTPPPSTIWQKLSYFFLLPNVLFPLFPIVDYKTYLRTYYDGKANDIYQKGINWMLRGVTHLLIYKIVYYYFSPSPREVVNVNSLVVYIISNYSLLFRISGQSHLIIGMLVLFGFNLPLTFNKYFLASGFSDFWRRINIYWKDFLTKTFYYPVYFLFKRMGMTTATVITLLIIFFMTWMLHSYQWFWIKGIFPVTLADSLFWGIFGILIVINSVMQIKRKKRTALGVKAWSLPNALKQSVKVVSMFTFMGALWSLWMSRSVDEWTGLMSVLGESRAREWLFVVPCFLAAVGIGVVSQYLIHRFKGYSFYRNIFVFPKAPVTGLAIALILAVGLSRSYVLEKAPFGRFVGTLQGDRLNDRDRETAERGYYEPLLKGNQLTEYLVPGAGSAPPGWKGMDKADWVRRTGDLLYKELVPSKITVFNKATVTTNKWGMRDREYDKEKPAHTFRFALLGSSHALGSGVEDDQVFEQLVEDRLNRLTAKTDSNHFEILNFSVGGYSVLQCVKLSDSKIFEFGPDAVIYVAHPREARRLMTRSIELLQNGTDLEYDFLKDIYRKSGIRPRMASIAIQRKLQPYDDEIVRWGYNRIVENCKKRGAVPVWIYLPIPGEEPNKRAQTELKRIRSYAQAAGFITISLEGVYSNYDSAKIKQAPWDDHPNALGHRLVAELLYQRLMENKSKIGFDKNR